MAINTSNYGNYYNYNSYSYSGSTKSNSIYNLLNTSASNPVYGKNTASYMSASAQSFLSNAKTYANDLKATLANLIGTRTATSNPFAVSKAESSDADTLSIKSVDSKKATNTKDISVTVEQVATTQKNTGNSLTADGLAIGSGFTAGKQQMNLEAGGKSYTIEFTVNDNDTNKDVQQKIAAAINNKNVGVKAAVSYDSTSNQSTLSLESASTGVNYEGETKFSISGGSGKALELTGINNVTQQAQNAAYRVNSAKYTGALQTSKTNDVDIGNGVTATLKSAGNTTVSLAKDTTNQLNGAREMINSFNKFFELVSDNKDDARTKGLYTQLTGLAKTYSTALSRIGVSTNSSGYLEIDEDKMKKAAESGELEKFFRQDGVQTSFGFANKLSKIADDVGKDATKYVSATTEKAYNFSSNQTVRYNQYMNMGTLFDMMY